MSSIWISNKQFQPVASRWPISPLPLEAVRGEWHSHRLFIKRDDLTGSVLSGNKVRKLEYLLADACRPKCDVVITCGGIQSKPLRVRLLLRRGN